MRLVTVDTTRHARALPVGLEQRRDDRDEGGRQGPGRDELEDQVRDPERGEERVESVGDVDRVGDDDEAQPAEDARREERGRDDEPGPGQGPGGAHASSVRRARGWASR